MSADLQERAVYTNGASTTMFRVVKIGPEETWTFDLLDEKALPAKQPTHALRELVKEGIYQKLAPTEERRATRAMVRKAKEIYDQMRPAFQSSDDLLFPDGRSRWLHKLRETNPSMSWAKFLRYVRMWFACGCIPSGLLTKWDRCRWTAPINTNSYRTIPLEKAKKEVSQQALALTSALEAEPVPMNNEQRSSTSFRVTDNALRVFDHYYGWKRAKRGRTLKMARTRMVNEIFSIADPTGRRIALPLLAIPSQNQFDHWWKRLYSYKARRKANVGSRQVDLNEREIIADEISKVPFAGAIGSLDATIWNVYVRSRFPHRRVIGPPVVFRVRCKRSGMLLGLSVGLEAASWLGAASAIANSLEDKVEFCRKFGIAISPEDWPVQGMVHAIEADRGETDNHGPEIFIETTGVSVTNVPTQRPDIRPGTESDFNTLQVKMNGDTPGALVDHWAKRTGDDWKIKTVMDIFQFTQLLLHYELARMREPRPKLKMNSQMIAAGLDTSPISLWNWSRENEGGGLRQFHAETVRRSLLPRESGSIRPEGIYFRGLYYTCDDLMASDAFMKARTQGRTKVQIAFDPRLVDVVFLTDNSDTRMYVVCNLSGSFESQRDFLGKTFAEVKDLLQKKKENVRANGQQQLQSALDHHNSVNKLLRDADEETRAAIPPGTSKSSQKKDISKYRKEERNAYSPSQAFTSNIHQIRRHVKKENATKDESSSTKDVAQTSEVLDFLKMIDRIQPNNRKDPS